VFSGGAALASGALVAVVALAVLGGAWPGLSELGPAAFLGSARWQPSAGHYGAWAMIAGTLAATVLALAIALPLGGLAGLASAWLAPVRLGTGLRLLWMILAGLPSVVLGLWGLTALVPLLARWQAPGLGLLAAGIVLAVMVLPTIAVIVDAALRSVPTAQRQSAAALALGPWGALRVCAARTLRRGLATGGVLATARALGETMAVLLVAGNVVQLPTSLHTPLRTLTGGVALEMAYASGLHRSALFVLGLIALGVVILLLGLLHRLLGGEGELVHA